MFFRLGEKKIKYVLPLHIHFEMRKIDAARRC
jgi:hypothetical protein